MEVVRRHCGNRNFSGLVRDIRRGGYGESSNGRGNQGKPGAKVTGATLPETEFLDQLISFCQSSLSNDEVPAVLLEIGDVYKSTGEMQRAGELYSMAIASSAKKSGESHAVAARAEAFLRRGEVHSCLGQWKASKADLSQSRFLFAALHERVAVGRVDNILGTNHAEQGNMILARRCFQKAFTTFQDAGQKELAGIVLMNLGILLNIRGSYDEALGHYRRALSSFEELGDVHRLSQIRHNIGMTYLQRGEYQQAIKEFNLSYFLASKHSNISVMAMAILGKANASYRQSDLPLALKLVSQALALFEKCGDRLGQADGYKLKGMIHRDQKAFTLAATYFQTSLRLNRELGNKLNEAETLFELATTERRRRSKKAALSAYREALELFRHLGAAEEIKRVEHEMQELTRGTHAA